VKFTESHVENAALEWLAGLGYGILHGPLYGPDISLDGTAPERLSHDQVLLVSRSLAALERLNPQPPKLISGEIRLREAEKAVEAIA